MCLQLACKLIIQVTGLLKDSTAVLGWARHKRNVVHLIEVATSNSIVGRNYLHRQQN